MKAWGYVEYQKPLTEKEADDYELKPAPCRLAEAPASFPEDGEMFSLKAGQPQGPSVPERQVSERKSVLRELKENESQSRDTGTSHKAKPKREVTR